MQEGGVREGRREGGREERGGVPVMDVGNTELSPDEACKQDQEWIGKTEGYTCTRPCNDITVA